MTIHSYIVKHKNYDVRIASRSGGIFSALSDGIIKEGGVVYGCALNEKFEAVHKRAVSNAQRDDFRGSKYVQSRLENIFASAKEDLKNGYKVLFSGTPCQIGGFKSLCQDIDTNDLFCVDIVCHGVPSPMVWNDYLRYTERKFSGKVQAVNFRNKKKYGWAGHVETITINDVEHDSRLYPNLFLSLNISRESCFKCPYKNLTHPADITIADAWGVDVANPDFNDDRGISLVFTNNEKGIKWLNTALTECDYVECDINQYLQPALKEPFARPRRYDEFWNDYYELTFDEIIKKYCEDSLMKRIVWKLKSIVKTHLPDSVVTKIKSSMGREI